ncbi:hypothetical protein Scep_027761 [Stephania cephalantha]|uniref:Uncharacterized protein n=1 Tax=Stephania cephalantha TaxID=152367 RepID=A0AAP0HIU1_9MAGN
MFILTDGFRTYPMPLCADVMVLHALYSGHVEGVGDSEWVTSKANIHLGSLEERGFDLSIWEVAPRARCRVHVGNLDVGQVDGYLPHESPDYVEVKEGDVVLTTAIRKDDLEQEFVENMRHKLEICVNDS